MKLSAIQLAIVLMNLLVVEQIHAIGSEDPVNAVGDGADGQRYRVLVSTDIGGTDEDDTQSLIHLLLYSDVLAIEGLISSPYGTGRKEHILEVLECYEADFPRLREHSERYPTPEALRQITKQGETERAPYSGVRRSTEGSQWIVDCARRSDPQPLYMLVWGGIEDLAQALHDAPDILPKLRVYWIGGPNKKWSADAYQYLVDHHSGLWIIEANSTYRGWFVGGEQAGDWGNTSFVTKYVAGHGALGDKFAGLLGGTIKMGDTPAVGWILHGRPDDPSHGGWGGRFVRAWDRSPVVTDHLPTSKDLLDVYQSLELRLPMGESVPETPQANLLVENQSLPGHAAEDGTMRFRFCPKAVQTYDFKLDSNVPRLKGQKGGITSVALGNGLRQPSPHWPHWWTDDPAAEFAENGFEGVRSVSQYRRDFLSDFARRMARCSQPNRAGHLTREGQ